MKYATSARAAQAACIIYAQHTHTHTHSCSCQKNKRKCRGKIITATFHTLHIKFERRRAAWRIDELVFLGHPLACFLLLSPPSLHMLNKRMCHFIGHLLPAPAPVPAPPNTNVCLVALPSSRTSGAWLARQTNKEKHVRAIPWPWYL